MSRKQLQKLKALKGAAEKTPAVDESNKSDSSGGEEAPPATSQRLGFGAFLSDSDDNGNSDEQVDKQEPSQPDPPKEVLAQSQSSKKKKKKKAKSKAKQSVATGADTDEDEDDAVLDALVKEADGERHSGTCTQSEPADLGTNQHSVLMMREADFNVDNEYRRVFGEVPRDGRGGGYGSSRSARSGGTQKRGQQVRAVLRHLAIAPPPPNETWPKPTASPEMFIETLQNGEMVFDVKHTQASRRQRIRFEECLLIHDPRELQELVQEHPFCPEALLALAEMYRAHSENERAFTLIRRAVYSYECAFHPKFAPFQSSGSCAIPSRPRVTLRVPADESDIRWPGWTLQHALWLYMHGLAGQGTFRTALEVCKLLLAICLPRDPTHALLHLDFLCLRARQYDLLDRFVVELKEASDPSGPDSAICRLDLALPNFAYSSALAVFLSSTTPVTSAPLKDICIEDILPSSASSKTMNAGEAHRRLMRALLLFPAVLPQLLEQAGVKLLTEAPVQSSYRITWTEMLTKPPFSDAPLYFHSEHAKALTQLGDAFVRRCGALWHNSSVVVWLHECAGRLVRMYESSVFASDLSAARQAWHSAPLGPAIALRKDYPSLLTTEGDSPTPQLPLVLQRALSPPAENQAEMVRALEALQQLNLGNQRDEHLAQFVQQLAGTADAEEMREILRQFVDAGDMQELPEEQ